MTFTEEKIDRQLTQVRQGLKSAKKIKLLDHMVEARQALKKGNKRAACEAIDRFRSVVAEDFHGKPPSRFKGFDDYEERRYVRWLLPGQFFRPTLRSIHDQLVTEARWSTNWRHAMKEPKDA